MTIQLDWPPHLVARLRKEARQRGLSLDEYVLQTLLGSIPTAEAAGSAASDAGRGAREQAGRSIRELRKGNILGSELSIRDLLEEGRRF